MVLVMLWSSEGSKFPNLFCFCPFALVFTMGWCSTWRKVQRTMNWFVSCTRRYCSGVLYSLRISSTTPVSDNTHFICQLWKDRHSVCLLQMILSMWVLRLWGLSLEGGWWPPWACHALYYDNLHLFWVFDQLHNMGIRQIYQLMMPWETGVY